MLLGNTGGLLQYALAHILFYVAGFKHK